MGDLLVTKLHVAFKHKHSNKKKILINFHMRAREHTQLGFNFEEKAFSSPTSLLFYSSSNLKFGPTQT